MKPRPQITVEFRCPAALLRGARLADPAEPLPPLTPVVAPSALLPIRTAPAVSADAWKAERQRRLREESEAVHKTLEAVSACAGQLAADQRNVVAEMKRLAIDLAMTVATRIVHDKISAKDYPVEALVKEAVSQLGENGPVTVFLHPDDLALLLSRDSEARLDNPESNPRFLQDIAVGRGGVRVVASDTAVTARASERLAAIRRELLRSLGDVEPEL